MSLCCRRLQATDTQPPLTLTITLTAIPACLLAMLACLQVKILRADRDVYAAEIEGREGSRLLMKMGPGDFNPRGDDWSIADCGQGWSVWEAKAPAPAAVAPSPRKRATASKPAAAASAPVEQLEEQ